MPPIHCAINCQRLLLTTRGDITDMPTVAEQREESAWGVMTLLSH